MPPEKHFSKAEMAQAGVQLCLVPVYEPQSFDDNIRRFKLYLLNTLTEPFHFEYRVLYKEDADFSLTSTIDAQKDFYLHDIGQDALNDIARFLFLFSPVQADKTRMERLEVPLKIRPKTLFQKIAYMHQANEPSFSFMLFDTYPIKAPEPYFPLPEKGPPPYRPGAQEPPQSVVDLHMDKIPGGRAGLSGYEMLHAQLQYFEKCYQLAVAHMQPKLIVIHGIGSGRLRDEIHELLKHKREVRTFTNEYHAHFGFGATEIYFQY